MDLLSKKYRKESFKKWNNLYAEVLKSKYGIIISENTPGIIFKEIFFYNIYNIKDFTPKKDQVVIDVGVYYGDSAIWWAKFFNANVIAFEPNKKVFDIMQENIKLNNLENKITAYNVALGNGKEQSYTLQGQMFAKSNSGERIETKRLDDFSFNQIDILKIDVEGFEYEVLEGAVNTITKFKPKIILEVHSKELKKKCLEFLKGKGYIIYKYGRVTKNKDMNYVQNLFLYVKNK